MEIDSVFTKDIANNVWHIAPVPPGQLNHPCPFPEEIPYRIISLYSYPGDLVLDPFAGVGTTLKVAEALGRDWVGYETKEAYVKEAKKLIEEPLRVREQLVVEFAKIPRGVRVPAKNPPRVPFPRSRKRSRPQKMLFPGEFT